MKKLKRPSINDVKLAQIYFPILVSQAIDKKQLTYKELIEKARLLNPREDVLKTAIPVSTGRKLACIHSYCLKHKLPVLPSLVVNKATRFVGDGFHNLKGVGNPIEELKKVYEFDWSSIILEIEAYFVDIGKEAIPKRRMKEKDAIKSMSEFYMANKEKLPTDLARKRTIIIQDIMDGKTTEDAFASAVASL